MQADVQEMDEYLQKMGVQDHGTRRCDGTVFCCMHVRLVESIMQQHAAVTSIKTYMLTSEAGQLAVANTMHGPGPGSCE